MILGSLYERRLVAANGNPLSPEQQAREQQELETTLVERRKVSRQQRGERIAKYEKERESDHLLASGESATPSGGKTSGMSRRATPIRLSAIP
jgi:hypothetical protein